MADIDVEVIKTNLNDMETDVQAVIDGVANVDKSKVPTTSIAKLSGDTCIVLICVPTT